MVYKNLKVGAYKEVEIESLIAKKSTILILISLSNTVIPKVCSADHRWSTKLAEVILESLYKSMFLCFADHQMIWSGQCTGKVWEPLLLYNVFHGFRQSLGNPYEMIIFGSLLTTFKASITSACPNPLLTLHKQCTGWSKN